MRSKGIALILSHSIPPHRPREHADQSPHGDFSVHERRASEDTEQRIEATPETLYTDNCSVDYITQSKATKKLKDLILTRKRTGAFNRRFCNLPQ
jgi:hypothetical protein